ncbi:MAG: hypothetical protein JWM41_1205 [Gemmatimonadetes bacterium]|nr:hypothetical protein [Gemmatimonadota bacterium]
MRPISRGGQYTLAQVPRMHQLRRVILAAVAAALPLVTGSCSGISDLVTPLTPARSLSGTWSTPFAVPMNLQSDYCNGSRQTVAKQNWTVTWIITEQAGTSNGVDIEMRMQKSAATAVVSCNGGASSYVPEPSPLFMQGTISGSRLQFYNLTTKAAFDGSLTTDNITGTFGLWDCLIYCAGEQSDPLKFILTRNK